MTTVVLATRNVGKLREFRALIDGWSGLQGIRIVHVSEFPDVQDVVESGVTFEENATLKARAVAAATGLPAIADDSGLSVDVLGGCPGVFSARWAGTHGADQANIDLLLSQTMDVTATMAAHFVCCMVLSLPGGAERIRRGELHGIITRNQRGTDGFGYDPIFELPDGRTLAQLPAQEKNQISHRAIAMRAIREDLGDTLT
ncbi:RdgB/HAM1 family non-canonical purine NTP pyrophosphatase [Allobranchiibius huperziae]|uniref:dITP/XTP pyrophosphatase n=1 Tax=Allobranchiibius huperziae TaxID=1874116 RepID=A0A853DH86_9MICO|nr:RdgB/HAM1 family non-canonical purine NTP pyrophosphatase [Allobranchiibius huperziae]NYJ75309.1 XTP/dITP diphosphohydrolase [Allobranchiibius huperziae]